MTRQLVPGDTSRSTTAPMDRTAAIGAVLNPWREIAASGLTSGVFLAPLWRDICAGREGDVDARRRIVDAIDAAPALPVVRSCVEAILAGRPDRNLIMVLVAHTFDAYRTVRAADPQTSLSVAAQDLCDAGFGVEIVARGLQLARRACVFPPSIAEMIKGCRAAADEARAALAIIEMLEREATRARGMSSRR